MDSQYVLAILATLLNFFSVYALAAPELNDRQALKSEKNLWLIGSLVVSFIVLTSFREIPMIIHICVVGSVVVGTYFVAIISGLKQQPLNSPMAGIALTSFVFLISSSILIAVLFGSTGYILTQFFTHKHK